jgi:hypothetical protein
MKPFRFASFAFVLAAVLFTGMFVVLNVPEARGVQSADGALTVTGLVRTEQQISIVPDTSVPVGDPLLGLVYYVSPADVPLGSPIALSFARRADLGTEDATTVYRWNSSLGMWVPVPSVVADTADMLAVEVLSLGYFALGVMPEIDMPTLLTAQDTLRAKASIGTRGYRLSTAYTLPGGVPVEWSGAQVLGGCGGRVGAGERTEYSSTAQTVTVLVNDVLTPVEFTIVGEWVLSGDGAGCPASMPLKVQE